MKKIMTVAESPLRLAVLHCCTVPSLSISKRTSLCNIHIYRPLLRLNGIWDIFIRVFSVGKTFKSLEQIIA